MLALPSVSFNFSAAVCLSILVEADASAGISSASMPVEATVRACWRLHLLRKWSIYPCACCIDRLVLGSNIWPKLAKNGDRVDRCALASSLLQTVYPGSYTFPTDNIVVFIADVLL